MQKWEPLSEIWTHYTAEMMSAAEAGLLEDPEQAEHVAYPVDLYLGEGEKEDIRDFVSERMEEILEPIQNYQVFDPNQVASYLFRALICGMRWEKERIG
jgi:hypothetical protein